MSNRRRPEHRDAHGAPIRSRQEITVAAAVVVGVLALRGDRARLPSRDRALAGLVLAALAVAWVGLVAVMTTRGFSGNARYLLVPGALVIVVGAVGIVWAVRALVPRAAALPAAATALKRATSGLAAPTTLASTCCVPVDVPSVQLAAARPSGPVSAVSGETDPSALPAGTNATRAPFTGRSLVSFTTTASESASGAPTCPDWPSPCTIEIAAGSPSAGRTRFSPLHAAERSAPDSARERKRMRITFEPVRRLDSHRGARQREARTCVTPTRFRCGSRAGHDGNTSTVSPVLVAERKVRSPL